MSDVHSRLDPVNELTRAVDAARDGDDEAFRYVYRALHPGLLRYLRGLVGDDAEDVASEVWLQIVRDLRTFVGDGDGFRGWAATIARRRALDHLRYHRRRPSQPVPVESLVDHAGNDDTAVQAGDAAATEAAIALIATLPRDQAEAVLLRVVVGLDAQSAAQVLGKRSGAVRTASYRGLRKLAKVLDSLGVRDFPAPTVTPGVTRTKAPTLKDMR